MCRASAKNSQRSIRAPVSALMAARTARSRLERLWQGRQQEGNGQGQRQGEGHEPHESAQLVGVAAGDLIADLVQQVVGLGVRRIEQADGAQRARPVAAAVVRAGARTPLPRQ